MRKEHERLAYAFEYFGRQFAEYDRRQDLQSVAEENEDKVVQHSIFCQAEYQRIEPASKEELKIFQSYERAAEQPGFKVIPCKRVIYADHRRVRQERKKYDRRQRHQVERPVLE